MNANRSRADINAPLLGACLCVVALAGRVAEHGVKDQVLVNLECATDGMRCLMVERRAPRAG